MTRKLKVYRTAIGFHDAYVAAASQKAALEAWGTDKPLFARGAAEEVTDADLTAEPLASPGKVVKRLRGTEAEQIAALPPDDQKGAKPAKTVAAKKRAVPKPSRAKLDAAESSIDEAESTHHARLHDLDVREKALREERRSLEKDQERELDRLVNAREAAAAAYRSALKQWQD